MLNEADFLVWCTRLALTETARGAVAGARSRNPARRVGGGRRNVSGRYPSRKMGATIQFESHRVELPFVYEMEHDPKVLEYYDQPPSILLAYKAANGRRLSVLHTPDYFVLRHDSAGWEECKTADELEKLAVKSPNRYHGTATAAGAVRQESSTPSKLASTIASDVRLRSTGFSSETFSFWRTISDLIP